MLSVGVRMGLGGFCSRGFVYGFGAFWVSVFWVRGAWVWQSMCFCYSLLGEMGVKGFGAVVLKV